MKKKLIKALIACLIVSAASTGGYYGYNKFFSGSSVTAANSYKVVEAKKMNMQIGIQGTGNVYAGVSKDVAADNNGVLKDLSVKVGDTVEAGTKLFVSDSDDLRQSLEDAQSNLDKQKLTLENDTNSYNDSLAKANAAISDAETALNNAHDQLNKMVVTSPVSGKIVAINNKNSDEIKGGTVATGSQYGKVNNRNGSEATVVMLIEDGSNPNKKVEIKPNNDGVLKNLSLKVGDSVQSGQALFASDSDTLRQNVEKAQSNLDKQNAALTDLKNSNKLEIDSLNISDAQTQFNSASDAVNKMTVTAPIGGVVTVVNNSNGDNIQTSSVGGSSQSSSGNSQSSSGSSSGQSSGRGSGQTTSSQTSGGQNTSSSSTQISSTSSSQTTSSIITIVDPSSMKVKVQVDELDIAKIKQGQTAEIRFDAIKDKTFEGQVESIPQTGTTTNNVTKYDVVVSITNPIDIKIGMSANVNILTDSKDDTLVIPAEALTEKDGKKYVTVQNGSNSGNITNDGKLVEVKTGIENEKYIEILEGINENEKLLVAVSKQ